MYCSNLERGERKICDRGRTAEVSFNVSSLRSTLCLYCYANDRISALELLDEVEELNILLDHYALSWAVKVPSNSGAEPWLDWDLAPITTRT